MLAGAAVYIVYISTKEGAEAVRRAGDRGQTIFGETCPHYLLLDPDAPRVLSAAAQVQAVDYTPAGAGKSRDRAPAGTGFDGERALDSGNADGALFDQRVISTGNKGGVSEWERS